MIQKVFVASLLVMISQSAFALKSDTRAPINIESTNQSVDMKSSTITFSGNVIIKQGTIQVNADKVKVIRQDGQPGSEIVIAYGTPVHFSQMQENGKPIKGRSNQLTYDIKNKKLIMTGQAYLEQLDSNIRSERIVYLTEKQTMQASGGRVKTTLDTVQLQKSEVPAVKEANKEVQNNTISNNKSSNKGTNKGTQLFIDNVPVEKVLNGVSIKNQDQPLLKKIEQSK